VIVIRKSITVLVFAAIFCGANGPVHGMEVGDDIPEIDTLFSRWDTRGSPGCAVAVSQGGSLVYSRGYGYANLDYDIPVTPQTVFDVASVTKQFVAASLSMLEQDGKLSFDDDIRKWLPELPEYEWPITLEHMVYHTAGLRDYLNLFPLAGRDEYYPISHQQILDMMSRQRALVFQPGERYLYSNTAYMLLAQVVQRVSGKSLDEFVQERIFEPLNMKGSLMYDNFERIIPQRAIGYVRDDDDSVRMTHNYNFDVAGDGQMYTTVVDLLRWDDYLHGEDKPEFYPVIMLEGTLNSGVKIRRAKGLFLDEYRDSPTVHHTGSSWGFRTVVKRFVDHDLGIAIACNDDNSYPRSLAFKIADHFLERQLGPVPDEEGSGESPEPDSPPGTLSLTSDQLAEFTGVFHSAELDATYRFDVVDRNLVVRIEQEPPVRVKPVATDKFGVLYYESDYSGRLMASVEFTRNGSGAITGFSLDSGSERGIMFETKQ